MGRILRVGLMVLLVAAAGVGNVVGNVWEEEGWETSGNWQYAKINETTCRIKPKDKNAISTKVDIPEAVNGLKVVEIAKEAFYGCNGLTEVKLPSGLTTIAKEAFRGCSALEAVDIPNSVTTIGEQAFCDCSSLTEVKLPSELTTIAEAAFFRCSKLAAVDVPSSVTTIGLTVFSGCSGLKSIGVESGNKNYCAESGVLFTKDKATLVGYPEGKPEESYTIPGSVTKIGIAAFAGCSGLQGVTIPGSVTEIGEFAFSGCSGLTRVTIPSSVTAIGYAFDGCSGLNAVYWLADANCTVDVYAFFGIASPATLYVRQGEKAATEETWWAKRYFSAVEEGYVVTLKDSDGNELGEQLVKQNGTAAEPAAPTKEGFTFVEWQLGDKRYDFFTPVTKDITLVAKWKKNDDPKTAVESVQLAGVRVVRNPVGEALELAGMERAARVEVYSVAGARVHAEALRGEPRVAIDARGWASGVYVVRVEASDGAKTLRVVK